MYSSRCTCRAFIVLVVVALLAAPSLAAKKPPAKKDQSRAGETARAAQDPSAPPKDAQWTLYCQALNGPAHVEQAKAVKDQLIAVTKMKDWYVIHQESESVIYYGFYRAIGGNDAKEKKEVERARRDRDAIKNLVDGGGSRIFDHCFFVEVAAPDPLAPPEWDLRNAQGYYSLQIAAFKDSPQRKQAAVEAVREARKLGVDAYYYHGETTSSVCVGAWPKSAVRGDDQDRELGIVPDSRDPNDTMLVLPQQTSDQDQLDVRDRDGKRIRAYAPTLKAVDPSLIEMMQRFPTHSVNGMVYRTKAPGAEEAVEDPTFVVPIPKPKPSLLRAEGPAGPGGATGPAGPELLAPSAAPGAASPGAPGSGAAGGGKLKSLGD